MAANVEYWERGQREEGVKMSENGAGSGRRLKHGRTGWCWAIRATSLAFGLFISQWLVRYGVAWHRRNGGFDSDDVWQLCFLSVPIWLAFLGWWRHLAAAASLGAVSIVLLGYALLWELHWSGWDEEVVNCTLFGSLFLIGAIFVLVARRQERLSQRDSSQD
jgi:hypothetical protein